MISALFHLKIISSICHWTFRKHSSPVLNDCKGRSRALFLAHKYQYSIASEPYDRMPRKKDSEYLILQLLVTDLCYVIILDRVDKRMLIITGKNTESKNSVL